MQFVCRFCCLTVVVALSASLSGCSDQGEASNVVSTVAHDPSINVESPLPSMAIDETESTLAPVGSEPEVVTPVDANAELVNAFLGTWQLYDHGTRTIVVNPDGTASMHIELDFFASLAYGSVLDMDLTWSVSDGVLSYAIVRGEPTDSVDRVINDYGRERTYRVIEVSDDALQLEDLASPGTFHDWTKIGDQG